jgi:hypothetical protein
VAVIKTEKRGVGDNVYYLVKVDSTVVGHHATKAGAAKQVKYLKRARKEFVARSKNPAAAKSLPKGRFVKVTAIKVSKDGKRLSIKFPGSTRKATKRRPKR